MSRILQEKPRMRCALSGASENSGSHTARSGQEPRTQKGTTVRCVLAVSP